MLARVQRGDRHLGVGIRPGTDEDRMQIIASHQGMPVSHHLGDRPFARDGLAAGLAAIADGDHLDSLDLAERRQVPRPHDPAGADDADSQLVHSPFLVNIIPHALSVIGSCQAFLHPEANITDIIGSCVFLRI